MDTNRIWSNAEQLKSLTGLSKDEAEDLIVDFTSSLDTMKRSSKSNGGRPPKYDTKGILIMLMMYYRHYITYEAIGALFDLNGSNVKRWVDDAEKALRSSLAKKNLSHLVPKDPSKRLRRALTPAEKSISMALNSLSEGR